MAQKMFYSAQRIYIATFMPCIVFYKYLLGQGHFFIAFWIFQLVVLLPKMKC